MRKAPGCYTKGLSLVRSYLRHASGSDRLNFLVGGTSDFGTSGASKVPKSSRKIKGKIRTYAAPF